MMIRPYLTTRAHRTFETAHGLAMATEDKQVAARALAVAAIRQRGLLAAALQQCGLDMAHLEADLLAGLPDRPADRDPSVSPAWTAWDEAVLVRAREEADAMGTERYSTEHLLLALLRDSDSALSRVLAKHGVSYVSLREDLLHVYQRSKQHSV